MCKFISHPIFDHSFTVKLVCPCVCVMSVYCICVCMCLYVCLQDFLQLCENPVHPETQYNSIKIMSAYIKLH